MYPSVEELPALHLVRSEQRPGANTPIWGSENIRGKDGAWQDDSTTGRKMDSTMSKNDRCECSEMNRLNEK